VNFSTVYLSNSLLGALKKGGGVWELTRNQVPEKRVGPQMNYEN